MAELGVTEFVIGRVLNHAAKGVTGKVYNQWGYLPEKRAALEKWGRHLESLMALSGEAAAIPRLAAE